LRHIINIITENNREKKGKNGEEKEVKTLTIENQKLVYMIDRMKGIKERKERMDRNEIN
jgi:hypothetical protein